MNSEALVIAGCALAGLVLGAAYFALLYRAVQLQLSAASLGWVIGMYLLRLVPAVLLFWLLARLGLWPLLAGLMGFVVARVVIARTLAQRLAGGR
jgi:F1F0 ATPase subunit 2